MSLLDHVGSCTVPSSVQTSSHLARIPGRKEDEDVQGGGGEGVPSFHSKESKREKKKWT